QAAERVADRARTTVPGTDQLVGTLSGEGIGTLGGRHGTVRIPLSWRRASRLVGASSTENRRRDMGVAGAREAGRTAGTKEDEGMRHRRVWTVASMVAGLALALALVGPALAATKNVTIAGFAFSPDPVTVNVGDTVTWTNNDAASHTATGTGFNT